MCIERRLVAPESSEDLLPCDCVRLVDGVVRAVSRAIVAIKTKSSTTAEIALGNSACNEVLLDDSGRAEQGANRSCTSTSTNLTVLARIHCGKEERRQTYDRDTVGVSAELSNVLLDPLEGNYLITNTEVALDIGSGDGKESKSGQAVVDLDSDDVLARREVTRILPASSSSITAGETTAMDGEQHRPEVLFGASFGQVRRLDVQEQALLATSRSVDLNAI